jgi:hypothetical protein
MSECIRTTTKTVNLGRLPVYVGEYLDEMVPEIGYHKYNIVSYLGSSFINVVEGNKKPPVNISFDSSGNIDIENFEYSLKDDNGEWTGWYFIANALDAMYWAKKCKKMFDDNFFSLEFNQLTGDFIGYYGVGGNIKNVDTYYGPNEPNNANYILGDLYMEYEANV